MGEGPKESLSDQGTLVAGRRVEARGSVVAAANTQKAAIIATPSICHVSHDLGIILSIMSTRTKVVLNRRWCTLEKGRSRPTVEAAPQVPYKRINFVR